MRLFRVIVLCLLLTACGEGLPDYPKRRAPEGLHGSSAALRAGARMFREKCASCHGHAGEGRSSRAAFFKPPAPVFSEQRYLALPADYLYWRIETGKHAEPFRSRGSVMPAWGSHLAEDEIWHLVVYLKSRAQNSAP